MINKAGWTATSGQPTVIRVPASVALKQKWITQAKVDEITDKNNVYAKLMELEFDLSKDLNGKRWKDFEYTAFTDKDIKKDDFYLFAVVDGFHR